MNTEIIKKEIIEEEIKLEIISLITNGIVKTAEDISQLIESVSIEQAIELLNDDSFYLRICAATTAKLRIMYHTEGVEALQIVLRSHDNKEKIAAFDRIAKLSGAIKENTPVNLRLSLEDLLEEKEKRVFKPSLNLERINGNIFEAEFIGNLQSKPSLNQEEESELDFLYEE